MATRKALGAASWRAADLRERVVASSTSNVAVPLDLRGAEQTVLGPLHARALDARRSLPLLGDVRSVEIAARLAFDFSTLRQCTITAVVRTLLFDSIAKRFLAAHASGTVVDVGVGLNPRFDRIDNGRVQWFDVDLPRVSALRRRLLPEDVRRRHVAGCALDDHWLQQVATTAGPHCFLFEAVLGYLPCHSIRPLLAGIAKRFPAATIAFDPHPRWVAGPSGALRMAERDEPVGLEVRAALAQWSLCAEVTDVVTFLGAAGNREAAGSATPPARTRHPRVLVQLETTSAR